MANRVQEAQKIRRHFAAGTLLYEEAVRDLKNVTAMTEDQAYIYLVGVSKGVQSVLIGKEL